MIDVKLNWDNTKGFGDLGVANNDFEIEDGLITAVYLSLYTDQRAAVDDELDDINDRRGWWGDTLETGGDKIGSRIWLYERQKITTQVMAKIKESIEDCLQWMIDDGVVADIQVTLEKNGLDKIYTEIKLYRESENFIAVAFSDLWAAQVAQIGG